jgi:hypothetical protein
MRAFFLLLPFLGLLSTASAWADDATPDESQLLVPPPMIEPANPDGSRCFDLVNKAPYTVMGSIISNYTIDSLTGKKVRDMANFRLASGDKQHYCTYGPYYPGTRLGILLRTIVPTFSCYTVAQGTIEILGEYTFDKGSHTWIDCQ